MVTRRPLFRFIASFAVCLAAGYADLTLFLPSLPRWFAGLHKPSFTPSAVQIYFGIILVSVLLGAAMYLLWNLAGTNKDAKLGLTLLLFGLVLNVLWFYVFFQIQSIFIALIVIGILVAVSAAVLFLLPCFAVVVAATCITFLIFLMNSGVPILKIP